MLWHWDFYEKGEIVFGIVYNPFTDEMFQAAKGEGAYLNGRKIQVSDTRILVMRLFPMVPLLIKKRRGSQKSVSHFYSIFMKCGDFRRTGSAELDMCYVACGREHGYIERDLKPRDYSAGTVILREAGGVKELER